MCCSISDGGISVRFAIDCVEQLTSGVRREGDDLVHDALGIRIRNARMVRDLAADLGLVSTRVSVSVARVTTKIPPWLHPAARPLPNGVLGAVAASVIHNAEGMSLILVAATGALAAGWVSGSNALTGLATAGLLILISVLVHEAGHAIAYRLVMPRGATGILVVRGLSCHLVRAKAGRVRDVAIVLAGAIAPNVVAAALLPLYPIAPFTVAFAILVALAHIAALALPVGDGASLRGDRTKRV
jgi:hypothetical protein